MRLRHLLPLLFLAFNLQAESPAKTEFVLFDGQSLAGWKEHDAGASGAVEVTDGEIIIKSGESLSGIIYTKAAELPQTNYEITLEAKRVDGVDFFCGLTFPAGGPKTCATLILSGWGGSVTGISSIDGVDAAENATGHYRKFENNKWYRVKLRVTPANLTAWVNDEKIIDQDIEGRKVGLRAGPIEDYAPLSLTTFQTTAALKNIKLTAIPAAAK